MMHKRDFHGAVGWSDWSSFVWALLGCLLLATTVRTEGLMAQDASGVETLPQLNEIRVNGRIVGTLKEAFDRVPTGGFIEFGPGVFRSSGVLTTDGVTLIGTRDTWLDGVAADGKAAITIKAKSATIDGVNCRNISVPSKNGACIRHEGGRLVVRNVHFKDSEQGILAWHKSVSVTVEDSIFENLGKAGLAHAFYIQGQEFILKRTRVLRSVDGGHEIKARTARTIIQRNLIASMDGNDSRLLDLPNGGRAIVTDNLFVEGAQSVNRQLIAFALEPNAQPVSAHLTLRRNVFVNDRPNARLFLFGDQPYELDMTQNFFVGSLIFSEGGDPWPEGNSFFKTRAEFGLPEAPKLPDVTLR